MSKIVAMQLCYTGYLHAFKLTSDSVVKENASCFFTCKCMLFQDIKTVICKTATQMFDANSNAAGCSGKTALDVTLNHSFIDFDLIEYNISRVDLENDQLAIDLYHRIVEAFRFSYAERSFLADPDFVDVTEVGVIQSLGKGGRGRGKGSGPGAVAVPHWSICPKYFIWPMK